MFTSQGHTLKYIRNLRRSSFAKTAAKNLTASGFQQKKGRPDILKTPVRQIKMIAKEIEWFINVNIYNQGAYKVENISA